MKVLVPIILALGLAGCPGSAARYLVYVQDAEAAAAGYVGERWDLRRQIRSRCIESLWREVDALEDEGRYEEARRVLDLNYPPLLTVNVIRAYRSGETSQLDRPWGCQSAVPE